MPISRHAPCHRSSKGKSNTREASTGIVSQAGANIDEVHHQRAFTMLAAQNVEIQLVVQTRGREHVQSLLGALHAAGFEAEEE